MTSPAAPNHKTRAIQTLPTPKVTVCIPLELKDEDARRKYCYHGGKCKCPQCKMERNRQLADIEKDFDAFMPDDRLKLLPGIRQAKPMPYRMAATQVSPEFSKAIIKLHEEIRKQVPLFYLPARYYVRDAYNLPGPNHVGTQTEIRLGLYGIDGCPCLDKSKCWDL